MAAALAQLGSNGMAIPGNAKHLSSPKGAMALKAETQHPASKFALETDFRGDVRVMHWDTKDASSLQSHAEFARAIAGAYDLPPAWSASPVYLLWLYSPWLYLPWLYLLWLYLPWQC